MTTEELEALLEGAEETDALEFKGPMDWNRHTIAKDILAMANVQDGGRIVFGIEDVTLDRIGLTQAQIDTFHPETMRDQIAEYADPHVVFRTEVAVDRAQRQFVVLTVSPFVDVPVICRRDGPDAVRATIYYRSKSRRPQSAPVSNSTDMRDILERAAVRQMIKFQQLGLSVKEEPGYDYDAELGDL